MAMPVLRHILMSSNEVVGVSKSTFGMAATRTPVALMKRMNAMGEAPSHLDGIELRQKHRACVLDHALALSATLILQPLNPTIKGPNLDLNLSLKSNPTA